VANMLSLEGHVESVDPQTKVIMDWSGRREVCRIELALCVYDVFGRPTPDVRSMVGKRVRLMIEDEPAVAETGAKPPLGILRGIYDDPFLKPARASDITYAEVLEFARTGGLVPCDPPPEPKPEPEPKPDPPAETWRDRKPLF
jgi:hypothetical protein